jgi:hypothetical protein
VLSQLDAFLLRDICNVLSSIYAETCDFQPLVSGDSMVPDVRLTASGSWDQFHTPDRARLNSMAEGNYGGGWIANTPWTADQWIQVQPDDYDNNLAVKQLS